MIDIFYTAAMYIIVTLKLLINCRRKKTSFWFNTFLGNLFDQNVKIFHQESSLTLFIYNLSLPSLIIA